MHRLCAWDLNLGQQDGRRRWIHWTMAAPNFTYPYLLQKKRHQWVGFLVLQWLDDEKIFSAHEICQQSVGSNQSRWSDQPLLEWPVVPWTDSRSGRVHVLRWLNGQADHGHLLLHFYHLGIWNGHGLFSLCCWNHSVQAL